MLARNLCIFCAVCWSTLLPSIFDLDLTSNRTDLVNILGRGDRWDGEILPDVKLPSDVSPEVRRPGDWIVEEGSRGVELAESLRISEFIATSVTGH